MKINDNMPLNGEGSGSAPANRLAGQVAGGLADAGGALLRRSNNPQPGQAGGNGRTPGFAPEPPGNSSGAFGPEPADGSTGAFKPAPAANAEPAGSIYEEIAWEISIDGQAIRRLLHFELHQKMGSHHRFELRLYHTELEAPRSYKIDKTKDLLGKPLTAVLGTHVNKDITRFSGIITEVAFEEKTGLYGEIILRGASPTILLEGGPHLHSFYNSTLSRIAKDTIQAAGGGIEQSVNPKYTSNITYTVQHAESHFGFLTRLAQGYGEWFYYDGEKLCFGKPQQLPEQSLTYARHLLSLRMSMQAVAMNFESIGYRAPDDQPLKKTAPQTVQGLNFYGDTALRSSDKMYASAVRSYPRIYPTNQSELDNLTNAAKAARAAEAFSVSGESRHPAPRPGLRLIVQMGDGAELGRYLVTESIHRLDNTNKYSCRFTALAADVEVLPVGEAVAVAHPHTEAQIATVKDNADPQGQGRVRAQFLWQSGDNMTPWMRVSTPDAGGGGKVAKNRGFVFVPEVGDQVIVGFENGNPDAPFVLGSLFHGKTGSGGGAGNRSKSMFTRSGINLSLDDDDGSAKLEDPSGNIVKLNGDGTITIYAPNKIDINSTDINIAASNNVSISATNVISAGAKDVGISASDKATLNATTIGIAASGTVSIGGTLVKADGKSETTINGGKVGISGVGNVTVIGAIVKINS